MEPVGSSFNPLPAHTHLSIPQAAALRAVWPVICEQHPYIPSLETPQQMLAWLDHPLSNLHIIHVKSLNLNDLELTEFPSALVKFHHLKELDLSGNALTTLPHSIGQMNWLRVLKLRDNQFQIFPAAIKQLGSRLLELDIADNALEEVPIWIDQLHNLSKLNLDENHLTTLPCSIGHLSELTVLSVAGNQLTQLPAEMGHLTELRTLFIDGNPSLHQLPPELCNRTIPEFYCDQHLYNALPDDAPILDGYCFSLDESMDASSEGSDFENADFNSIYFD